MDNLPLLLIIPSRTLGGVMHRQRFGVSGVQGRKEPENALVIEECARFLLYRMKTIFLNCGCYPGHNIPPPLRRRNLVSATHSNPIYLVFIITFLLISHFLIKIAILSYRVLVSRLTNVFFVCFLQ